MTTLARANLAQEQRAALRALKLAILEDATYRYEHLIQRAMQLGISDEEIDVAAHEAIAELFARAEAPVTARTLAHLPHR